jgi:crossover junction endodeoxyribonuclease RuvC
MISVGIDIGLEGAVAVLDDAGQLAIHDMPVLELKRGKTTKRELDLHGLVRLLRGITADHYFVEQVASRPQQGVVSSFNFGRSYGATQAILVALDAPLTLVPPRVWKSATKTPAAKDAARLRASQVLPKFSNLWTRKRDDGRAEAALLAWYGQRQLRQPDLAKPTGSRRG